MADLVPFKKTSELLLIFIFVCMAALNSSCNPPGPYLQREPEISFDKELSYKKVASDSEGNLYFLGTARESCDLDPGRAYVGYVPEGPNFDIILTKFDSDLNYDRHWHWKGGMSNTADEILIDRAGNILIYGSFTGEIDTDPGKGTNKLVSTGARNAYLFKLDSGGNFIFAQGWEVEISGIATDSGNNIFITGKAPVGSIDLDPSGGIDIHNLPNDSAFLTELTGNCEYVRSVTWNASWNALSTNAVGVDGNGNIIVSGAFKTEVDLDPGPGSVKASFTPEGHDIFVVKLDPDMNFIASCVWGDDIKIFTPKTIAIDSQDRIYVAGTGSISRVQDPSLSRMKESAFLACFDAQVNKSFVYEWDSFSQGSDVKIDGEDSVYLTGLFYGTVNMNPEKGSMPRSQGGKFSGCFLVKFDSSGKFKETETWEQPKNYKEFASSGNGKMAYADGSVEGILSDIVFLPSSSSEKQTGAETETENPSGDINPPSEWLVSFGTAFNYEEKPGSGIDNADYCGKGDYVNDLAIDSNNNIYLIGIVRSSPDFDPGQGVSNDQPNLEDWYSRAYLSKFAPDGNFVWVKTWDRAGGFSIDIDSSDNLYITGYFEKLKDFDLDPGPGTDPREVFGGTDGFVCKLTKDGDYIWGKSFGDEGHQVGDSIAVDKSGDVFISGNSSYNFTTSVVAHPDFNPCPNRKKGDGAIGFLAKLDHDGNFIGVYNMPAVLIAIAYSRSMGLDTDSDGNVYLASSDVMKKEIDFDPGPGEAKYKCDGFLLSLDPNLKYRWVWTWDGQTDPKETVLEGSDGLIYVAGCHRPERPADEFIDTPEYAHFIAAFDSDGKQKWIYDWSSALKFYGYSGGTADLALNANGEIYFTGCFVTRSETSDVDYQAQGETYPSVDAFCGKYNPDGNSISFVSWGREKFIDSGRAIGFDSSGNCYIAGVSDGVYLFKLKSKE